MLAAITYLSALESAPTILVDSRARILKEDSTYFQVSQGLRNLSHRRLSAEWQSMRDFSSILEQLQVAELLGKSLFHCTVPGRPAK